MAVAMTMGHVIQNFYDKAKKKINCLGSHGRLKKVMWYEIVLMIFLLFKCFGFFCSYFV